MDVLVTGGTGFVGTALCEELAGRGHDVTALARDPGEADFDAAVGTVAGDVTDRGSLEGPMAGRDAVVNLVALSPLFKPTGGGDAHFRVHLRGTENCVAAAEAAGVDRFLQQSALGADPEGDTAYIRAKGEAEAVVRESDLAWTIARPSVIFGEGGEFVSFTKKLSPPYVTPMPGGGRTRFQPIWREEVVAMLADAVEGTATGPHADEQATDERGADEGGASEDPAGDEESAAADGGGDNPHAGQIYELGGPEVLTLADVARLAWAAEGRPVNVVPVPMSLAGVGLKALGAVPGAPFGADQYRSLRMDNTVADNDVEAFGYREAELRTLADYLGADETAARGS